MPDLTPDDLAELEALLLATHAAMTRADRAIADTALSRALIRVAPALIAAARERDRLREALEVYARDDYWIRSLIGNRPYSDVWTRHENGWTLARAALAGAGK